MYPNVLIDVVGGCNAKCPLCVTGRVSFGQRLRFMSVDDFARVLDRLLELELAIPGRTVIHLHNWGEPVLHPDLDGLVAALNARRLLISISTNSSKATGFTVSTEGFDRVVFSMPGWSQASYDKVHGLRFDRVVANIEATMRNMRATGYRGKFTLSYHVYQFNAFEELAAARAWCDPRGIELFPYYAFINDYEPMVAFLTKTMPVEQREEISRTLFLHYLDDLLAARASNETCWQWDDQLTINHRAEVLLCCVLPETHEAAILGSVFALSRDEIVTKKKSSPECATCFSSGAHAWCHNFQSIPRPPDPHDEPREGLVDAIRKHVAQLRFRLRIRTRLRALMGGEL